ncbi:MAG TPA: DHA2 family efflux MFS transporter permease subunit [Terriglobales bacterium]|nr:DHA2 family efflux MFS transporter permease subunit [Terriglobales bacterium]
MASASASVAVPRERDVNPWIIAIAVMLGTFMEVLDTTVVNVSLPHIAGSLSASVDEATWVLTSYLVSNAIVLPMTGWLSNHFGRKRVLMTSIAGFTVASVACGMAPSLPFLIIFRIIQGATGGGLQPLSQAIMLEAFPPEGRGKAMAFWGLGIVVAPMLGPVMGGWITDNYSWRWVFYINLPVGIMALIMSSLFIFDPKYISRKSSRVDYMGIGLLALGIGALQIMLDKGQEADWFAATYIQVLLVLTIVGLAWFVINELLENQPIVDLRVFKNRSYATGVFLMTVLGFVLYGSTVLIPIYLQQLLGYPALQAGWAMLPRGLGSFIAMPFVGVMMSKVEPRKLLGVGLAVAAYSLWALGHMNLNAGYWDVFWPQFIQGLSMGFVFVPLTTTTHDSISKERMGNATSLFNLMRNIGASIGIAMVTTIVARHTQTNMNVIGRDVTASNPAAAMMMQSAKAWFMSRGMDAATAAQQAYASVFGMVAQQASMAAFIYTFRLLAIIFVLILPLILIMKPPSHHGGGGGAAMH